MRRYFLHAIVFILLSVAVYAVWRNWTHHIPKNLSGVQLSEKDELALRGQYGDSYGALNTLFTGFAFVGLAFTIYLQLYDARGREIERSAEVFEARFFRLTDSLRSVVDSMVARDLTDFMGKNKSGKDVFGAFLRETQTVPIEIGIDGAFDVNSIEFLKRRYETIFLKHQDDLGPYFRLLYHIVRYADRSSVENKEGFVDIVRAELSSSELCLLAINCLTENGEKFKPLVERYHLLKHLPSEGGAQSIRALVEPHYDKGAFED